MLRLTSELQTRLLTQPESGMGYQLVDAIRFDGRAAVGIAFNAEFLLFDEERREALNERSYDELIRTATSAAGEIKDVRVRPARNVAKRVGERSVASGGGAEDAPPDRSNPSEAFVRFSAYANDKRIRPDNSLEAGSYATTREDASHVKTGAQAVERYALPNPKPASYRVRILPTTATTIQRGIAQPKYGHAGGGVEVIFTEGTQPNSVSPLPKLPD